MFRFSPKFPFNLQTLAGVKPPGDSRRPRAGWQVGGGQGAEVWTRKERQILVGGVAWPAPFCTLFPSSHSGPHRWVRTRSCPLRNTCRLITVGSCRGTCGYHGQKQEGRGQRGRVPTTSRRGRHCAASSPNPSSRWRGRESQARSTFILHS